MEKKDITIKNIYINDTKRDGSPLLKKDGEPYVKLTILTSNDTKLYGASFNEDDAVRNWKVGESHSVLVEQKGDYINFLPADTPNYTETLLTKILQEIKLIRKEMKQEPGPQQNPFDELDEEI